MGDKWKRRAIKYKDDTKNELLLQKLLEEERIEREKELANKTYECPICFCDFTVSEMYVLDECFHKYCAECLKHYIINSMNDGNVTKLICPNPECEVLLHVAEVRHLVP